MAKGSFIVIEGLDGCGKSTQIEELICYLRKNSIYAFETAEPSESVIGKIIRKEYLSSEILPNNRLLSKLLSADRYIHLVNDIIPMIDNNSTVICSRFYLSNMVYQSLSTNSNIELIRSFGHIIDDNKDNLKLLKPDIHIYIKIRPEVSIERLRSRTVRDNYEKECLIYREAEIYDQAIKYLHRRFKDKIYIVDGEQNQCDVTKDIIRIIKKKYRFEKCELKKRGLIRK